MNGKLRVLHAILHIIEKISLIFGYISGGFAFLMMVIIGYDVLMRHIFDDPTIWADEVSCYLLVGITFLGATYALLAGTHIKVDLLTGRLSERARRWLDWVMTIVSLFFLIVLTWKSIKLVIINFTGGYRAPTNLATPLYVPQLVVALGLAVFCLQILILLIRQSKELLGRSTIMSLDPQNHGKQRDRPTCAR